MCMEWSNVHTGVWLVVEEYTDSPMVLVSWVVPTAGGFCSQDSGCSSSPAPVRMGTPALLRSEGNPASNQTGTIRIARCRECLQQLPRVHEMFRYDHGYARVHQCSPWLCMDR
jgi:hypothetical protein